VMIGTGCTCSCKSKHDCPCLTVKSDTKCKHIIHVTI
jgi:hypothetical protein